MRRIVKNKSEAKIIQTHTRKVTGAPKIWEASSLFYSMHSKSFQSFHCKLICASWPQDSFAKSRPRVGQSNPHKIRIMDLTSLTKKVVVRPTTGYIKNCKRTHLFFLNILKTSSLEKNASYISFWNGPLIWKGHVNFREIHCSFH